MASCTLNYLCFFTMSNSVPKYSCFDREKLQCESRARLNRSIARCCSGCAATCSDRLLISLEYLQGLKTSPVSALPKSFIGTLNQTHMTGAFPCDMGGSSAAAGQAVRLQRRKNLDRGQSWSKECLGCPNPPCVQRCLIRAVLGSLCCL